MSSLTRRSICSSLFAIHSPAPEDWALEAPFLALPALLILVPMLALRRGSVRRLHGTDFRGVDFISWKLLWVCYNSGPQRAGGSTGVSAKIYQKWETDRSRLATYI